MPVFGDVQRPGHRRRRRLHPRPAGRQHDGADDFGGVGPVAEGLAAWLLGAVADHRPDPLDRRAPRGPPEHADSTRRRRRREPSAATPCAPNVARPDRAVVVASWSPSAAASLRRSATAPTTPATCSGWAWPRRLVRHRLRARLLGQVPRLRRARRAAARAAGDDADAERDELHERARRSTGRPCSAAGGCSSGCSACRSSAWSSASSARSGRSVRSHAASGPRTAWAPGSRLVTLDGAPIELPTPTLRPARHGVPRGRASASTTPRSCCCGCRPSC